MKQGQKAFILLGSGILCIKYFGFR